MENWDGGWWTSNNSEISLSTFLLVIRKKRSFTARGFARKMQLVAIILIIWQVHHSNLLVPFLQVISLLAAVKRLRIKYLYRYLKSQLPSAWLFWLLKCLQDNEPKSTWLFAWSVSISPTDKIIIIIFIKITQYCSNVHINNHDESISLLNVVGLCSAQIAQDTE